MDKAKERRQAGQEVMLGWTSMWGSTTTFRIKVISGRHLRAHMLRANGKMQLDLYQKAAFVSVAEE